MDKIRRNLVMSAPALTVLGLSACGGGSDGAQNTATTQGTGGRASAQAVTTSNNPGLAVNGSDYILGVFLTKADAIFIANNKPITMVADASIVHGCLNNGVLNLTLWMGADTYQRAVTVVLNNPVVNSVHNVAQMPSGSAAVLVTAMQFDAGTGKGNSVHYDYLLNGGTVKVTAYTGDDITLQFAGVTGAPTPAGQVANNAATRKLQLDGTVTVRLAPAQNVAWLA